MDPSSGKDTRDQPWKAWVKEELEARKKADETEAGRREQEERVRAFEKDQQSSGTEPSVGNKAG